MVNCSLDLSKSSHVLELTKVKGEELSQQLVLTAFKTLGAAESETLEECGPRVEGLTVALLQNLELVGWVVPLQLLHDTL